MFVLHFSQRCCCVQHDTCICFSVENIVDLCIMLCCSLLPPPLLVSVAELCISQRCDMLSASYASAELMHLHQRYVVRSSSVAGSMRCVSPKQVPMWT